MSDTHSSHDDDQHLKDLTHARVPYVIALGLIATGLLIVIILMGLGLVTTV